MSVMWMKVPLGELLVQHTDTVLVEPMREYPMAGVYGFGRGLFSREVILGSSTSYTELYRLHAGDFVISRVKAWEGAVGIVPNVLNGHFVSKEFPSFRPRSGVLDVRWLRYFFASPSGRDALLSSTKGLGARRERVNESDFLSIAVPLPPIVEQGRILACVDDVAQKIEEVGRLRILAQSERQKFIVTHHLRLSGGRRLRFEELFELDERRVAVEPSRSYPHVGVSGFGRGLFSKKHVKGSETTYRAFNELFENALVISQVKGWEGAVAVCDASLAGRFVSPEYRTFRCREGQAEADYVARLVTTSFFHEFLKNATHGAGGRRQRTRLEKLAHESLPMPTVTEQRRAAAMFKQLDVIERLSAVSVRELGVLLRAVLTKAFRGELWDATAFPRPSRSTHRRLRLRSQEGSRSRRQGRATGIVLRFLLRNGEHRRGREPARCRGGRRRASHRARDRRRRPRSEDALEQSEY